MRGPRWTASQLQWVGTVSLAAVAAVLGIVGFASYLPTTEEFAHADGLDIAYFTLQLFVIDPAPIDGVASYGVPLEVARFLAPLATVLAVVQTVARLFNDWFRSWIFRRSKGHVIVVGDGPAAAMLARKLVPGPRRVVLVGTALPAEHARRHGLLVVPGLAVDEETLAAAGVDRAGQVYALAATGSTNAAVALAVRAANPNRRVEVHAQVRDDELVIALRSLLRNVADQRFSLSFFVVEDVAARVLLDRHPAEDRAITIVGFGAFPQAVLREIGRRHLGTPGRRSVTIVTAAPESVEPVRAELRSCNVDLTITPSIPSGAGSSMLYVCYADADAVLRAGIGQQRDGAEHVVLCLRRLGELGEFDGVQPFDDAAGKLAVFGILDEALAPGPDADAAGGRLRNSRNDRIARALHARYLAAGGGDPADAARVPWHRLTPAVQLDNYAAAKDVVPKLARIGARLVPSGAGHPPFAFDEPEVDLLAQHEHERWRTAKLAAGFRRGPKSDRSNPDICDWDELPRESQDLNRSFVLALPEMLGDAGFQIVRNPPR